MWWTEAWSATGQVIGRSSISTLRSTARPSWAGERRLVRPRLTTSRALTPFSMERSSEGRTDSMPRDARAKRQPKGPGPEPIEATALPSAEQLKQLDQAIQAVPRDTIA